MRSRFSILSLGISLLGLPVALAQAPPPLPLAKPAPAAPQFYPPVAPQPLKVVPVSPQGTLTGVPVMPPASTMRLEAPPGTSFVVPLPQQGGAVLNLQGLTWTYVDTAPVKPQTRVFEVADLVASPVQIPGAAALEHGKTANAHLLMKMIVAMAKPESWERGGGQGKIEYIAQSECLCATNSPEVLAEVKKLLDGLRRMQDQQVVLEVVVVSLPEGTGAKAGWPTEKGSKCLTPHEMKKTTETLKTLKAEGNCEVISRPTLTMLDGQTGFFQVGQQVPFTQFSQPQPKGSEVVVQARTEMLLVGTTLRCTPTISMDGKSVSLKSSTTHCTPNSGRSVSLGQGKPPALAFDTIELESTVMLPNGNSAITFLGSHDSTKVVEEKTAPVLEKVPYINRLFKVHRIETKTKLDYYQIVTARILKPGEEVTSVNPACCSDATAVKACPQASHVVGVDFTATVPAPPTVPPGLFSFYTGWTR